MPAPDKPAGPSGEEVKVPKSKGIPSIRAQAKRDRQNASASSSKDDRAASRGAGSGGLDATGMDKSVVKAVLASPMTVTWPPIPTHLQSTIMAALPKLVPVAVSDWHVGRARCHTATKKEKRRAAKEQKKQSDEKDDITCGEQGQPAPVQGSEANAAQGSVQGKDKTKPNPLPARSDPTPPNILDHLVVGLNETIKTLERQITQIRIELGLMAEALVLKQQPTDAHPHSVHAQGRAVLSEQRAVRLGREGHPRGEESHLLPTAPEPAADETMTDDDDHDVPDSAGDANHDLEASTPVPAAITAAPTSVARDLRPTSRPLVEIQYILIPHLSLNPISLGVPVLRYAATYNALVYQYNHLLRIIRTRLGGPDLANLNSKLGSGLDVGKGVELRAREEVSVIPLGKQETELSLLVGLRRVASLAIARTHPSITVLRELVPKSVLKPPRFGLTVAMPVETVLATYGVAAFPSQSQRFAQTPNQSNAKAPPAIESGLTSSAPAPVLPVSAPHYAPLHIKGISTTVPADGMARKRKRLEEVRARRVEKKAKRKAEREQVMRAAEKGLMTKGPENVRQRRKARKEKGKV